MKSMYNNKHIRINKNPIYINNMGEKFRRVNISGGFAILYTMMIIAIAMVLSMGIIDLVMNQRALSNIARESLASRSATDVGLECMLYLDKLTINGSNFDWDNNTSPIKTIDCGKDNAGSSINYTVTRVGTTGYVYTIAPTSSTPPDGPCFNAYYTHITSPISTKIDIFGYNRCDPADPLRAERGLIIEY